MIFFCLNEADLFNTSGINNLIYEGNIHYLEEKIITGNFAKYCKIARLNYRNFKVKNEGYFVCIWNKGGLYHSFPSGSGKE